MLKEYSNYKIKSSKKAQMKGEEEKYSKKTSNVHIQHVQTNIHLK